MTILDDDLTIRELQREAHETARGKGWWDVPVRSPMECLMLIVTELAEAAEELRTGRDMGIDRWNDGKPEGFGVELADAVIRVLDLAGAMHIDLAEIIAIKMRYNMGRTHRHGGKVY